MSQEIIRRGKYITIHAANIFFNNLIEMLLEHFDVPERKDNLFLLSTYLRNPISFYRKIYPNHKIVVYQLEQMLDCNTYFNPQLVLQGISGADEIWDYDPLNAQWLSWAGIKVNRIVPMLYTESLEYKYQNANPQFDVVFLGILGERRWKIMEKLQGQCYGRLKIAWVFGDPDMEYYIKNSKVSLNLHSFEPWCRQEQVRMFVPIINGQTVVSEPSQLNVMGDMIIENKVDDLGYFLQSICSTNIWKDFGQSAKLKFKDYTQKLLNDWPEAI